MNHSQLCREILGIEVGPELGWGDETVLGTSLFILSASISISSGKHDFTILQPLVPLKSIRFSVAVHAKGLRQHRCLECKSEFTISQDFTS